MERIMSELDRLHEIIDTLPPQQVRALLTLLGSPKHIGDEEFARRLAEAPEEEVDEETIARILAAETEQGGGEVKGLKGALKGRHRLGVGKWRIFFSLDQPSSVVVTDVDNRGQAY